MSDQHGNTINKPAPGSQRASSVLDLGGIFGLSEADATSRLAQEGPKELPAQKKRSLLAIGFVYRHRLPDGGGFCGLVNAGVASVLGGEGAGAGGMMRGRQWAAAASTPL